MNLMVGSLYDALRAANVDDARARRAAEDVANFEGRLNGVEGSIARLDQKVEARFTLLQWMIGFNLALTTAILFRLFF
jgi:hypothetical protein